MPKVPTRERGHSDAGNDGGGQRSQEQKDHHHHQRDGQDQLELHVSDRGADGGGPVGQNPHVDGAGERSAQGGQELFDPVHYLDNVGAGLALDVDDDGRSSVHPRGELYVFSVVYDGGDVGKRHRGVVPIGDHQGFVVAAPQELVVGADGVGVSQAVEISLSQIHVRRRNRVAQVFQIQMVGRQEHGIGLNPATIKAFASHLTALASSAPTSIIVLAFGKR